MKRFLACILALTMVLSLAACGGKAPGPDSIVTKFCDAMKKSDYETMKTCLKTSSEDFDDLESGETGDEEMDFLLDYVKDKNKEMTYKVESVEENDNQGTVKVTFNYNDIDEVTAALISDVKNDLAELPEYKCCTGTAAYPPERTEGIRRVKKYKYEILGVVFPQYGEKNTLVEYGITEAEESQ